MAPKKGRRSKHVDDDEDLKSAAVSIDTSEADTKVAATKKTSKKKQARKNKKSLGDWSDTEEVEQGAEATGAIVNGGMEEQESAIKDKKNLAAAKGNFAALHNTEDDHLSEAEADTLPQKPKGKTKTPGSIFAALQDDDPETHAEAEDEETAHEQPSTSSSSLEVPEEDAGYSIASKASIHPELNGHAAEDAASAQNGVDAALSMNGIAVNITSKKGSSKARGRSKSGVGNGSVSMPQVAKLNAVEPHPNADSLKVCSVETRSGSFKVVTSAVSAREGLKVVFAEVGVVLPGTGQQVKKATLRGVDSFGMLCSAFDMGWTEEPDGMLIELPDIAEVGDPVEKQPMEVANISEKAIDTEPEIDTKSKKKKKKKAGDLPAAFAALDLEAEAISEAEPAAMPEMKPESSNKATSLPEEQQAAEAANGIATVRKSKAKGKDFDLDAALMAASITEDRPAEKKKKGKKKIDFDVDAMLAQATSAVGADNPEPTSMEPAAAAAEEAAVTPAISSEQSKMDKKKKDKAGDEEDIDALLAEFGVSADLATDGRKSKKKRKGKAIADKAADSETQAQALEPPETSASEPIETSSSKIEEAEAIEEADAQEDVGDGDGEKELTAAQKKKQKKKAKEKAKKAGDIDEDAPMKKGPVKKESAAVRRLREEMERQKAAHEAAQKAEEERIRLEEEAALRAEEEAKRKEEEKKRKKEEKAKERAELKRKGLLLTGKEKAEAERLAAIREQLLRENPGLAAAEGQLKRKPMYSKKKGPSKKQDEAAVLEAKRKEEDELTQQKACEEEEERRKQEEHIRQRHEEEAAALAAAANACEAEDSDDVGWDEIDVDQIKLPGQSSMPEPEKQNEDQSDSAAATSSISQQSHIEVTSSSAKQALEESTKPSAGDVDAARKKQKLRDNVPQEAAQSSDEDSSEAEETEDEEDSDSEEDSSEEASSSEYSDSDESIDSEKAREERVRQARAVRAERLVAAKQAGKADDLRSPICCILGHVDTGKTKLLDNIRRTSVQEGEAGGITQQIGATYVPGDAIRTRTEPVRKGREFGLKVPGLLIIDTPGHESFTNLRSRGSSLCDIAILVVDIMHGLEPQTIESINLLKQKKTPFIVALNKVDRLFEWNSNTNAAIQDSLAQQAAHVKAEFETNLQRATLNLNEQGLNVALYWKNTDPRKYVNIVPTSAITGEGLPDMLQLVVQLTQKMMAERLMFISELQCTVLEVKVIEGLGTTIDVVLVNGVLREGDQIVLCGLQGPIVTSIRSLLTPHPLKELRVRGSYLHHKEVKAAEGIKIAAQNLENAVAGTQMLVVQKGDSIEDLKEEVMGDMTDIFKSVDKSGEGVCVQASTLGSLEALLEFLRSDAVKIPVSGINIGPVHKKDVMRASTMLEKGRKKYAVILAFDVPVTKEAQEQAQSAGVRVFTADIIYHLFDQFSAYLKHAKEEEQLAASADAVFPVILQILENCIFNAKDPIVLGCSVEEGIAKVGTPLCIPSRGGFMLGKIASMELNHKPVDMARRGDNVALKIESSSAEESAKLYGRHFDFRDKLVSKVSRRSIDLLKLHFKDSLERDDWRLVVKLKKMFGID